MDRTFGPLAASLAGLTLLAPALAQQPPPAPELVGERRTTREDVEALTERLEQLAALKDKGVLSPPDLTALTQKLIAAHESVTVSGELKDVPLSLALEALMRAVRAAPARPESARASGPGLVIRPADLEVLATVRVTASFTGTPAADALRALLRSQEAMETLGVEFTEEGQVFVVAVHRFDEEEDAVEPQPQVVEEPEERVPGYLGVGGPATPGEPLLVATIEPGSPAEQAGLRPGDVIAAIDGAEVRDWDQLRARIRAHQAGDDVVLDVTRGTQRLRVLVTLGAGR